MSLSRINKIVIANRGEIACRIIKTARNMGIETVAVYSDPDKNSLHVKMATESYCIGPAASQQSYLRGDKILSVAKQSKSNAIHPGYGFLSENVEFANSCQKSGVIFIGPPESAIRDMGIKSTSKYIMQSAGVPVIQGYHDKDQDLDTLKKEAEKIGYPVMIKAVRGGGGKGMRIAMNASEFQEQLESAKREALKSFNDEIMLLEKFIETPRHVEVQIFGDTHGNYVHLCERDCSIQRRHQKVLEEAPGPGITHELRKKLGDAAVKAAAAVKYVGAGTVEFIMDSSNGKNEFFFMEMNTRLQVEHPVTELITGLDLVEWQLRVAAGEPLPITDQAQLDKPKGHALEARIYAEDCSRAHLGEFMPTAGQIRHLNLPSSSPNIRIDTGVEPGDQISVHYDPMIAKLIVWSHDRNSALCQMLSALKSYHIIGLPTNIAFLTQLVKHDAFFRGEVHTDFIKQHSNELAVDIVADWKDYAVCAVAMTLTGAKDNTVCSTNDTDPYSPFNELLGFRINHCWEQKVKLKEKNSDNSMKEVTIIWNKNEFKIFCDTDSENCITVEKIAIDGDSIRLNIDGVVRTVWIYRDGVDIHMFGGNRTGLIFTEEVGDIVLGGGSGNRSAEVGGDVSKGVAPMPGVIERILVKEGQVVALGDAMVTMIAMKMEYSVRAGCSGRVESIQVKEGETVAKNHVLVQLHNDEAQDK